MVVSLGLVWGATFLFIEIALQGITPFWLAAYRIGFAALLTLAVWALRGGALWLTAKRNWPSLILIGVMIAILALLIIFPQITMFLPRLLLG